MSNNTIESLGYKQELKRALTVPDLVCYGLIFMVPIAPFGIYGTVMSISQGMVALAYSIGLVGMVFTAFSYWRMAEEFPISGSVYGYASKAIGKPVGTGVFGADMQVALVNDGPVTICIDTKNR